MVKDKAINVKPYKMERNRKEILVSGHSRQAKGVNKRISCKGQEHDLKRNGKTVHIPEYRRRARNSDWNSFLKKLQHIQNIPKGENTWN